jgi:hypothetical protein
MLLSFVFLITAASPARAETDLKDQLDARVRRLQKERSEAVKKLKAARKRDAWVDAKAELKDIDINLRKIRDAIAGLQAPPPPPLDSSVAQPLLPPFSVEVLGDGGLIGVAKEPGVRLACDRGSIRLPQTAIGRNGYLPATCSATQGVRISEEFEKVMLPAYDSCIRKLAFELGQIDVSGPIEMAHLGIISAREIARAHVLSLHEAGRAIDISQVKIGDLHFDYLPDLLTRGQPGSKWEGFWKKLEYCATHSSDHAFFWPIDAESEAETIVERDIPPSLEAWVAKAKPEAFPHYKEYNSNLDEDGNPTYELSDEDQNTWDGSSQAINDVAKTLVPYVLKSNGALAAKKDPDLQAAILKMLQEKFGLELTPAQKTDLFLRALKIGPILHRDHLHFSLPFTRDPGADYAQG